jgi:hypothetical protein
MSESEHSTSRASEQVSKQASKQSELEQAAHSKTIDMKIHHQISPAASLSLSLLKCEILHQYVHFYYF